MSLTENYVLLRQISMRDSFMTTNLGLQANANKIGALLEYICNQIPHIHLRKLLKVIYLMDEKSVQKRSFPLTWLDYYAWKKGPVAPCIYEVKEGAFADYVKCVKEDDNKWYVSANKTNPYAIDQDMRVYSEFERDIINSVIAYCKNKSADDLTDETHSKGSLWAKTVSKYKISFDESGRSDYLICLNDLNDEEGKEIYTDALDSIMMQASINSAIHV